MEKPKNKRQKGKNFKPEETRLLINCMEKYKGIIENKQTDGTTVELKNNAWQKLAQDFNCAPLKEGKTREVRTHTQLKNYYENYKRRVRKENANDKAELYKTGGGQFVKQSDADGERLIAMLKPQFEPDTNEFDSATQYHDKTVNRESVDLTSDASNYDNDIDDNSELLGSPIVTGARVANLKKLMGHNETQSTDEENRITVRATLPGASTFLSKPTTIIPKASTTLHGASTSLSKPSTILPEASTTLSKVSTTLGTVSTSPSETLTTLHKVSSALPKASTQANEMPLPVASSRRTSREEFQVKTNPSFSDSIQIVDRNNAKRRNSETYESSKLELLGIEKNMKLDLIAQNSELHERAMEKLACEIENLRQAKKNEQELHELEIKKLKIQIQVNQFQLNSRLAGIE